MAVRTFRFMDLPKEIRFMVYERMPLTTRRHVLKDPHGMPIKQGDESCIILVKGCLAGIAILGTSRLVHEEARRFVEAKLEQLRLEPTRYIFDNTSAESFCYDYPWRPSILGLINTAVLVLPAFKEARDEPVPPYKVGRWGHAWPAVQNFVIKCATWIRATKNTNVASAPGSAVRFVIQEREFLYRANDTSIPLVLQLDHHASSNFDNAAIIVKQDPSADETWERHNKVQHMVSQMHGTCHPMREPDAETWAREWEEGDF